MKILIIDDEENMCHMLSAMLARHGYEVLTALDGEKGIEIIKDARFDFILCDVKMPNIDGMAFLEMGAADLKDSTVIMMSAFGNIDLALQAMKRGAYDFISKPFKSDEVLLTLKKAEERERLKRENLQLKKEIAKIRTLKNSFGKMVAKSGAMKEVFGLCKKVASYNTTVLITGESGTGKELVAKAIHEKSDRSGRKFIAVNCGSIPENLIESELFGYVKGAFTGADRNRKGLFEEADTGTLFLDEIGELPISLQVKLLRALQEREIKPVGSAVSKKVDVRVLAATARNLQERVEAKIFREDLYYRLNVLHVKLPPLRERKEDIPILCHHFIKRFNSELGCNVKTVSPPAMKLVLAYPWPGNVRELENAIQRGVVVTETNIVEAEHLPGKIHEHSGRGNLLDLQVETGEGFSLKKAQQSMEKNLIARALAQCGGNKTHASGLLEISYPSLLSKIKTYNI